MDSDYFATNWTQSSTDFIEIVSMVDNNNYTLPGDKSGLHDNYILTFHGTNLTSLSTTAWPDDLKPILDIILLALVIIMMLSMGCEVHWEHIVSHLKRPISLCIGMGTQFIALPLFSFTVLVVCGIKSVHAAGVLIVSCCPGGVLSNTFTYLCDGDLPLSIAMTTASTIAAMGMLPVNTWLYGRKFESDDLVIPYFKMALSMIVVTSPTILGMLLKWKLPNVASRTAKIGVHIGLLLILFYFVAQAVILHEKFAELSPSLLAITLLLPVAGFVLGYGLSTVTKQKETVRKTIAIETGFQNLPLAVTIITLSFPTNLQDEILVIPFMYAFTMIGGGVIYCIVYSFCKKYAFGDIKYKDTRLVTRKIEGVECGYEKILPCVSHILVTTNGKHNDTVKFISRNEITDFSPKDTQQILNCS